MRRVANFNKITTVSSEIKNKCTLLQEKKHELENILTLLSDTNDTPAINKVIVNYKDSLLKIDRIVNGLNCYIDYMNNVSKEYNQIYDIFKTSVEKIREEDEYYDKV